MDQFDIVKRIGSGSFGVALLVKKKNEGPSSSQYVIKQINLTGMSAKEIKEAEHEVSVLQTLSGGNSFIIGYHEAFTETKKLHIVLDYVTNLERTLFALRMIDFKSQERPVKR